ncbi:MAG: RNA-guided endonuclease InsQ/TnpB family protein [Candidatus Odinarchaeota archaeon]
MTVKHLDRDDQQARDPCQGATLVDSLLDLFSVHQKFPRKDVVNIYLLANTVVSELFGGEEEFIRQAAGKEDYSLFHVFEEQHGLISFIHEISMKHGFNMASTSSRSLPSLACFDAIDHALRSTSILASECSAATIELAFKLPLDRVLVIKASRDGTIVSKELFKNTGFRGLSRAASPRFATVQRDGRIPVPKVIRDNFMSIRSLYAWLDTAPVSAATGSSGKSEQVKVIKFSLYHPAPELFALPPFPPHYGPQRRLELRRQHREQVHSACKKTGRLGKTGRQHCIELRLTNRFNLVLPPEWRLALKLFPGCKVSFSGGADLGDHRFVTLEPVTDGTTVPAAGAEREPVIECSPAITKTGKLTIPKKIRDELPPFSPPEKVFLGKVDSGTGEDAGTLTLFFEQPDGTATDAVPLSKSWSFTIPPALRNAQHLFPGEKAKLALFKGGNDGHSYSISITAKQVLKTVYTTVKVPLIDDHLTSKKMKQLAWLASRDTAIIRRYLDIIEQEEEHLWYDGKEGSRLDKGKLDTFTLTSVQYNRKGKVTQGRSTVKHDLKEEFSGGITVKELKECRDVSVGMWHIHLEKLAEHDKTYWKIMSKSNYVDREDELARTLDWWENEKKTAAPCHAEDYQYNPIPRRANIGHTAFFHERDTKLTRYWLAMFNSADDKQSKQDEPHNKVNRLWLPLNPSPYHLDRLALGRTKTVKLVKHNGRWYAHFAIDIEVLSGTALSKPVAVLSIDLGIKKAAVTVLLTPDQDGKLKASNIRIHIQKTKKRKINVLDNQIASLQRKMENYREIRKSTKNVIRKLKELSGKRQRLAIQYDHELTAAIAKRVEKLEKRYTVYVAIGQLQGIRHSRRKGDGKSQQHRRLLHRWAFARVTAMLAYKLQLAGVPEHRFVDVPEGWTSKTCYKCGSTDTRRPFQSLLICNSCGANLQADINGAMNIAFKLIISLDEASLDQWLTNPFLDRKYPDRSARGAGRRSSRASAEHPPMTSRPSSGDARAYQ